MFLKSDPFGAQRPETIFLIWSNVSVTDCFNIKRHIVHL
jgi:hypothetical protein